MNGAITMTGGSKEVDLQSVNGSVEVTSPATRVHAESVNGSVTVRDASGEVEASTVNGTLAVIGGTFDRARPRDGLRAARLRGRPGQVARP